MKIFFLILAWTTVSLIYGKFKATYLSMTDTFRVEFLIVPCGGLACLVNHDYSPVEVIILILSYPIHHIFSRHIRLQKPESNIFILHDQFRLKCTQSLFTPAVTQLIIKKAILEYGLEDTNHMKHNSIIFCKSINNFKTVLYIFWESFWSSIFSDSVDVLYLPGSSRNIATAIHDKQDWWGRVHHHALSVLSGMLSSSLYTKLDLQILHWTLLWSHSCCCWSCADYTLCWLRVPLHN